MRRGAKVSHQYVPTTYVYLTRNYGRQSCLRQSRQTTEWGGEEATFRPNSWCLNDRRLLYFLGVKRPLKFTLSECLFKQVIDYRKRKFPVKPHPCRLVGWSVCNNFLKSQDSYTSMLLPSVNFL